MCSCHVAMEISQNFENWSKKSSATIFFIEGGSEKTTFSTQKCIFKGVLLQLDIIKQFSVIAHAKTNIFFPHHDSIALKIKELG